MYFTFQKSALLSDTKVAKYVFKHLVCSDFAYDVAEVEDALAPSPIVTPERMTAS